MERDPYRDEEMEDPPVSPYRRRGGGRRLGSTNSVAVRGEEILRLRLGRGWTQAELGRKSGISKAMLSVVENNIRGMSPQTLRRLASTLEIEPEKLLGDASEVVKLSQSETLTAKDALSIEDMRLVLSQLRSTMRLALNVVDGLLYNIDQQSPRT